MLHRSLRIYPNGDIQRNTVESEHLDMHIDYNKNYRFGCSLIIDGELAVKCAIQDLSDLENIWIDKFETVKFNEKCTMPYS